MAIKVKDLIKKLEEKEQDKEVEFVVVGTDRMIVCMDIKSSAHSMAELLSMFNSDS